MTMGFFPEKKHKVCCFWFSRYTLDFKKLGPMLVVYWGVEKKYKATVLANLSIKKKPNKVSQCFCFFALFISYLFLLISKKQSAQWSVSLIHSFYIDCKSSYSSRPSLIKKKVSRVKGQQYFPGYRQNIAIPQEWKSKVLYEFSINKSTL